MHQYLDIKIIGRAVGTQFVYVYELKCMVEYSGMRIHFVKQKKTLSKLVSYNKLVQSDLVRFSGVKCSTVSAKF